MKHLSRLSVLIIISMIALLLSGCGTKVPDTTPTPGPEDTSITVVDGMGRSITLPQTPKRIISLAPSNTEILFALGLGDKVVGVTEFCDFPAEAVSKEKVGGFGKPNIELIISLEPDVIFASSLHKEAVEELEILGIQSIVLNAKSIENIFEEIKLVGRVTGTTQAADILVAQMKDKQAEIIQTIGNISDDQKPMVYYEVWGDPIMSAGPGSHIDELIVMAGGINLAGDTATNYPTLSLETLIEKQPQIMIHSQMGDYKADILTRVNWDAIPFFREGNIIQVDENTVNRAGPRIIEALELFARAIHPDKFN